MSDSVISPENLRKVLHYDSETGLFTWKERPVCFFSETKQGQSAKARCVAWNAVWAGTPALNSVKDNEYLYGRIFDRHIYAHRAAWCFTYGKWPKFSIDHMDGNRQNNCILNLRDVTHSENLKNVKMRSDNTSGKTGVYFSKKSSLWYAKISVDGKVVNLGWSKNKNHVIRLRKIAEKKHGYTPRLTPSPPASRKRSTTANRRVATSTDPITDICLW